MCRFATCSNFTHLCDPLICPCFPCVFPPISFFPSCFSLADSWVLHFFCAYLISFFGRVNFCWNFLAFHLCQVWVCKLLVCFGSSPLFPLQNIYLVRATLSPAVFVKVCVCLDFQLWVCLKKFTHLLRILNKLVHLVTNLAIPWATLLLLVPNKTMQCMCGLNHFNKMFNWACWDLVSSCKEEGNITKINQKVWGSNKYDTTVKGSTSCALPHANSGSYLIVLSVAAFKADFWEKHMVATTSKITTNMNGSNETNCHIQCLDE